MDDSLETGKLRQTKIDLNVSSHCWICEGWTQVKFEFDPSDSTLAHLNPGPDDQINIHLSIDDYKPDTLDYQDFNKYSLYRMVPPKEVKYFFSINN